MGVRLEEGVTNERKLYNQWLCPMAGHYYL